METTVLDLPAPVAPRLRRPGWRDPRLLAGVAMVAGSVALGSWAVRSAQSTVPVYVARTALVPGDRVEPGALLVQDVQLGAVDLGGYLRADRALPEEVDFILENAGRYLEHDPTRADVLSVFAGLRPLVQPAEAEATKKVSREHAVLVSAAGLVTLVGGKWTTYRKMAEDTLEDAIAVGGLEPRPCGTEELRLHGYVPNDSVSPSSGSTERAYGSDLPELAALERSEPELARPLHPALPYRGVHVVWAVRRELARSLEDVLARRTRSLLLDARASIEASPAAATLLARELGRDAVWREGQLREYTELARGYLLPEDGAGGRARVPTAPFVRGDGVG